MRKVKFGMVGLLVAAALATTTFTRALAQNSGSTAPVTKRPYSQSLAKISEVGIRRLKNGAYSVVVKGLDQVKEGTAVLVSQGVREDTQLVKAMGVHDASQGEGYWTAYVDLQLPPNIRKVTVIGYQSAITKTLEGTDYALRLGDAIEEHQLVQFTFDKSTVLAEPYGLGLSGKGVAEEELEAYQIEAGGHPFEGWRHYSLDQMRNLVVLKKTFDLPRRGWKPRNEKEPTGYPAFKPSQQWMQSKSQQYSPCAINNLPSIPESELNQLFARTSKTHVLFKIVWPQGGETLSVHDGFPVLYTAPVLPNHSLTTLYLIDGTGAWHEVESFAEHFYAPALPLICGTRTWHIGTHGFADGSPIVPGVYRLGLINRVIIDGDKGKLVPVVLSSADMHKATMNTPITIVKEGAGAKAALPKPEFEANFFKHCSLSANYQSGDSSCSENGDEPCTFDFWDLPRNLPHWTISQPNK
jgi:hypothetical protein